MNGLLWRGLLRRCWNSHELLPGPLWKLISASCCACPHSGSCRTKLPQPAWLLTSARHCISLSGTGCSPFPTILLRNSCDQDPYASRPTSYAMSKWNFLISLVLWDVCVSLLNYLAINAVFHTLSLMYMQLFVSEILCWQNKTSS